MIRRVYCNQLREVTPAPSLTASTTLDGSGDELNACSSAKMFPAAAACSRGGSLSAMICGWPASPSHAANKSVAARMHANYVTEEPSARSRQRCAGGCGLHARSNVKQQRHSEPRAFPPKARTVRHCSCEWCEDRTTRQPRWAAAAVAGPVTSSRACRKSMRQRCDAVRI